MAAGGTGDTIPEKARATESRRAADLIAHAEDEYETDPQAALHDAEAALQIPHTQSDAGLSIQAHLLVCRLQYERNAGAAAAEVAQIKELLPRTKRGDLRAGALMCEAHVHEASGDHGGATILYERAVDIATEAHDDVMRAAALRSLGYLLGLQGDLASGLTDLRQAEMLSEKAGDQSELLPTLNNIAMIYNGMGDFAEAKHIYSRVLQAQRPAGPSMHLAVTTHNYGRVCENLQQWREARDAYNESLNVSQRIDYTRGIARALRGLAGVALATGDPAGALETLDRSDALQRQFGDARLHAQIGLVRGAALHRLGRLAESASSLREAIEWFRSADTLSDLAGANAELAAVYADTGDWHAAFQREAEYAQVTDKIMAGRMDQRFAALKVDYDTAAKEAENLALLRENRLQREQLETRRRVHSLTTGLASAGLISSLLLAGLLYSDSRRRRIIAREAAILGTLTQNLSDTVILLDPMLRIQFANRPFPGGRVDVIGRALSEVVPPPARGGIARALANVVLERSAAEFDVAWPIESGELRQFEQRATPVLDGDQLVGITLRSSDVTERRSFEEALRLEAKILDTMNEGVIVIEATDRIFFANAAMHALLGYAPGDLLGKTLSWLRPQGSTPRVWDKLSACAALSGAEILLRRHDGDTCLVSFASSPLSGANETALICVCRDISDERRVERAFAGASAREAVGVGNTLHEGLAQELTGVSMLLANLTSKLRAGDHSGDVRAAREYLAGAIRTASELARLVSPTTPVRGSLGDALTALSHDAQKRFAVPVTYLAPTKSPEVNVVLADQLCRITQEVLNYAVERRECTAISIDLAVDSGMARLSIRWTGLRRADTGEKLTLAGLDLVDYRARLIGGNCEHEDSGELVGRATVTAPLAMT